MVFLFFAGLGTGDPSDFFEYNLPGCYAVAFFLVKLPTYRNTTKVYYLLSAATSITVLKRIKTKTNKAFLTYFLKSLRKKQKYTKVNVDTEILQCIVWVALHILGGVISNAFVS